MATRYRVGSGWFSNAAGTISASAPTSADDVIVNIPAGAVWTLGTGSVPLSVASIVVNGPTTNPGDGNVPVVESRVTVSGSVTLNGFVEFSITGASSASSVVMNGDSSLLLFLANLTANVTGNDRAGVLGDRTLNGNLTFTGSSYGPNNLYPFYGTHNGTRSYTANPVTFSVSSVDSSFTRASSWTFSVPPTWEFSSGNGATLPGNAVFNSGASNSGTITGNATFNSAFLGGTINGNATLNGTSTVAPSTSAVVGGNVAFNNSSGLRGTLTVSNTSTVSFNNNSYRTGTLNGGTAVYDGLDGANEYGFFSNGNPVSGYDATTETYYIAGQATTLNSSGTGSWNGLYYVNAVLASGWIGGTYYISGNATSLDSSGTGYNFADNYYYITGTQTTLDGNGNGSWNGYYYITGTQTTLDGYGSGEWNGTQYLNGIAAATIRFTGNGDWNNSGNWQQGYVPRTIDSVEIAAGATCDSNSDYSAPSIIDLTLESGAVISIDLTVSGVATFLGTSAKGGTSVITGNAVFHPDAENRTGITGTVTFLRGRGINGSSILGVV